MSATELSAALWRERQLLELLAFKLEEEHLLLTNGRTRWLAHATREVEQVLERLKQAGLSRSVAVDDLALLWAAPSDATLAQLIEHAPDDTWAEVLRSHLGALTELTRTISDLRDGNEAFLRSATRATQETIASLGGIDVSTYDATGSASAARGDARLLLRDL